MNFLNNLKEVKKNFLKKENFYFLILIMLIFFVDRLTKQSIIKNFNENTYFINDFINLDLVWNTGIGFGLLSSNSQLFYNFVTTLIGFVILVLFFIVIVSDNLDKFIYSLIIGGALGNFYDRLKYSAVPDFIDFHYNTFHWFTFNIADIFISLGIFTFIMKGFFIKKIK